MRIRTTVILFVIATLLTAYLLLFEQHIPIADGPGKVFPGLIPADVFKVEIPARGAERDAGGTPAPVLLKRRGDYDWWIEKPIEFRGFLPRIQGLVWTLVDLVEIDRIPAESETYAKWAGADGPTLRIRFWTLTGDEHVVEIGQDAADARLDYLYVRVDGSEVIVTRKAVRQELTVGLDELRSRALFPIAPPDAVTCSVRDGEGAIQKSLRRDANGAWVLADDPDLDAALADRQITEAFLRDLNAWKIDQFEASTDRDLARFGLDRPAWVVRGEHKNGSRVALEVGRSFNRSDQKLVYLRNEGQPFVFSADAAPLDGLRKGASYFRTRYVFDFQEAEVQKVVCRRADASFTLELHEITKEERAKGEVDTVDDEVWVVREADGDEVIPGDRRAIGRALADLRELLIQKFLSPLGAADDRDAFDRTVHVELETGDTFVLRLGKKSGDSRPGFPLFEALRSTDRSRFLVESRWPDWIDGGTASFRNREISRLRPSSVHQVDILSVRQRWTLIRLPREEWSFHPRHDIPPDTTLDQKRINDLVRALGRDEFRVHAFLPDLPRTQYELVGIGQHVFRRAIELSGFSSHHDGFKRVTVGDRIPASGSQETGEGEAFSYARVDDLDIPVAISAGFADGLDALVRHLEGITREPER